MPRIAAETAWKDLYRLAGVAVLSMAAIIVLSIAGFAIWPYAPGTNTTTEIFTLIQSNRLAGLVVLDLGVTASTPLSLGSCIRERRIIGLTADDRSGKVKSAQQARRTPVGG